MEPCCHLKSKKLMLIFLGGRERVGYTLDAANSGNFSEKRIGTLFSRKQVLQGEGIRYAVAVPDGCTKCCPKNRGDQSMRVTQCGGHSMTTLGHTHPPGSKHAPKLAYVQCRFWSRLASEKYCTRTNFGMGKEQPTPH